MEDKSLRLPSIKIVVEQEGSGGGSVVGFLSGGLGAAEAHDPSLWSKNTVTVLLFRSKTLKDFFSGCGQVSLYSCRPAVKHPVVLKTHVWHYII